MEQLKRANIHTVFHFVPLHLSPARKKYARVSGTLPVTENLSERLVRLPLWIGMDCQGDIIESVNKLIK